MQQLNPVAQAATDANVRLYGLGRHALLAALRVIGIAPGDKVLVPAFVCRDLLASIHAVQAVPLYYPVDRTLAPQSLPAAHGVRAGLAINYFGFPQGLETLRAYCSEHDIPLIEDNAHGFLSCDASGKPLGTRGDIGIFSLRKTFSTPDGAALLLNRPEWFDRLPPPLPCRNDPLPVAYVAKRYLRQVQNSTGVRVLSLAEQAVRRVRRLRTGQSFPLSSAESETRIPGEPAIHCKSIGMLGKIDMQREIERRRSLYRQVQHDLGNLGLEPVFGGLPLGVAPYGYPFRTSASGAEEVARIGRRSGFDCGRWPELPAAVVPTAPEFYKNVWWLNFLC